MFLILESNDKIPADNLCFAIDNNILHRHLDTNYNSDVCTCSSL